MTIAVTKKIMTLISTITVISALSPCLCQLFARTEAYAIHRTCKPYSTDLVDKTGMIEAAMAEANGMLSRAAAEIVHPTSHQDDNTVHTIFRDVTGTKRTDIAGQCDSVCHSRRRESPGRCGFTDILPHCHPYYVQLIAYRTNNS